MVKSAIFFLGRYCFLVTGHMGTDKSGCVRYFCFWQYDDMCICGVLCTGKESQYVQEAKAGKGLQ